MSAHLHSALVIVHRRSGGRRIRGWSFRRVSHRPPTPVPSRVRSGAPARSASGSHPRRADRPLHPPSGCAHPLTAREPRVPPPWGRREGPAGQEEVDADVRDQHRDRDRHPDRGPPDQGDRRRGDPHHPYPPALPDHRATRRGGGDPGPLHRALPGASTPSTPGSPSTKRWRST